MNHKAASLTPEQALNQLELQYERSVNALRKAIGEYINHSILPDDDARANGLFVYPQLSVSWDGADHKALKTRAWGRFTHAGCYTTTITNPKLFRAYLLEQLTSLYQDYGAHISVGLSQHEIPYPYVIDGSALTLDRSMSAGLTRHFPTTELSQIGDETADGLFHPTEHHPLSHFDARRVDFSLARLRHYTGTPVDHFQPYVLFTNYTRYVDEFVSWGCSQILDPDSPYIALSCAGGIWITADTEAPEQAISDLAWKKHQMPAWHLITKDGQGITLINIGVGPANAKNICDHLAVLRPDVWLMIGHCGGLRESQTIGDYVLAHATCVMTTFWMRCCRRISRFPALPKYSARCTTPPSKSAACLAKRLNSGCVPARWSPRMTATGSCAIPPQRYASTSAAPWPSTWRAPLLPPRATASASRTARCSASPINRCTAKLSCRARPTAFMKGRSPSICR